MISDNEREIWKQIYIFRDRYHGCKWTDRDIMEMDRDVSKLYAQFPESLMERLLIALMEVFDEEIKATRDAVEKLEAEQTALAGVL